MHHRAIHLVEYLVKDGLACEQRANRNMSARQRLGEQHHVRFDVPVLDREKAAGPADPGLNLVGDKQRAVFAAQRGGTGQKFVTGHVDALALDRLDDKGRNLARGQRLLKRCQIVEGN